MQKIVIATPLYPPEQGGPRTYTLMLEDELPKHGFELVVVPFARAREWPKLIRHLVYCWLVFKAAKKSDIVYALDPVSVGLPAMIAAKLKRSHFIIRIPGDYAWEQGQIRFGVTDNLDEFATNKNRHHFVVRILKHVQSFVTKQAEKVIVPSQYMKGIVETWGVKKDKIIPIYTALSSIAVSLDRAEIRKKWNLEGTVLLSIARLTPWKGLLTLVDLFPEIQKQIPDARLVIVGEGPLDKKIKERVEQLGLSSVFNLYGAQQKDAIGELILGSDIFVLNTSYEGLSHQLLETMDLGTPIVTTNVGGNPELITHGQSGLLVAFDDKDALVKNIALVASNETLRQQIVGNAKEKASEFEQSKVVLQLVSTLHNLVKNQQRN